MYQTNRLNPDEMIAAIASPRGSGARGIIRVSGSVTLSVLNRFLSDTGLDPDFQTDVAQRYEFQIPLEIPAKLPISIYLWPTSKSYTGQPAAEIHTIGSPPVLDWLLGRLYQYSVRPALPGEFTLRSFLSGKLSLVQAEAVLGVIEAHSENQLDVALQQLAGGISTRMREVRDKLLDDLADLEAGLDFVDEDIDFVNRSEFLGRLKKSYAIITDIWKSSQSRMHRSPEVHLVLAGLPNAGKSSLFNHLTGSQALTSEQKGTTTDLLIAELKLAGQSVLIYDTAGWESKATGVIDEKSQQFRHESYAKSDLILWCRAKNLAPSERLLDKELWNQLQVGSIPVRLIETKSDLPGGDEPNPRDIDQEAWVELSVQTENGIEELLAKLEIWLRERESRSWEILGSTAARCRDSLEKTRSHLSEAVQLAESGAGDEFLAEEIRASITELGLILGHVYTDDLLDRVFSKFCIGK